MKNVENKKEQTAKEAYDIAREDIANLIGWLECELTKDDENIKYGKNHGKVSWGQVGNLQKVRSDLIETLAFLSNIESEQIKEQMEDARTLDNAK